MVRHLEVFNFRKKMYLQENANISKINLEKVSEVLLFNVENKIEISSIQSADLKLTF